MIPSFIFAAAAESNFFLRRINQIFNYPKMNVQILTMNGGVSHTSKDKYAVTSPFQIVADTGIVYTMCVTHDTPRLLYKTVSHQCTFHFLR